MQGQAQVSLQQIPEGGRIKEGSKKSILVIFVPLIILAGFLFCKNFRIRAKEVIKISKNKQRMEGVVKKRVVVERKRGNL